MSGTKPACGTKEPVGNKAGIKAAIAILQLTFDKYAGVEGDKDTLSKKEVATMLKEELPEIAQLLQEGSPDPKTKAKQDEATQFFQMLDEDGDGVVDFKEYIIFCATLAMLCN